MTLDMRLFSRFVSLSALRAEFPVLERAAYLNAGTDGPLPAAAAELERELLEGRSVAHFKRRTEFTDALRTAYAALLGCDTADLALTTCTTEGIAQTIGGLELARGDEILTSDEEHPGLLGALAAASELHGVEIREAPLGELAEAVDSRTRLVACSHVGWMSGSFAPAELAELEVPVLLDGAQGVGAVPVDVHALGCDAYAGAGQKWLCGPDGTGMLYVTPGLRERLSVSRRGYGNLADPSAGVEASLHEDARRFDTLALNAETVAAALAAVEVLGEAGWAAVHERAISLAASLAEQLAELEGREPAPRGPSTLVSFASEDPEGERVRLAEAGVILRNIPDRPWLRASVGAWNDENDLDRLLTTLPGRPSPGAADQMNSAPQTATPQAAPGALDAPARGGRGGARLWARADVRHAGLVAVVALSAVLNTNRLSQNGWANIFYSAGDQSMLRSLHNFLFVSFDPGGLISVDKPPLALWLQTASAKVFGFTPLSLLLPEAIAGVLAVGALYLILARRLGALAAFAGALAMAVFPSFVAVSRENGV